MKRDSFTYLTRLIFFIITQFYVIWNAFLPGDPKVPSLKPKKLADFQVSAPNASFLDKSKFNQAFNAQTSGDTTIAKKLYKELLNNFPKDSTIMHNLRLLPPD